MSQDFSRANLTEAARAFGVSVRTIQRKIENGAISETQISRVGWQVLISVSELARVFSDHKQLPNKENWKATSQDKHDTREAHVSPPEARDELVALLKDQLAKAEARAEREAEDRRSLEAELSTVRATLTEIQRQLPPPSKTEQPVPRRGFLKRLFGGA